MRWQYYVYYRNKNRRMGALGKYPLFLTCLNSGSEVGPEQTCLYDAITSTFIFSFGLLGLSVKEESRQLEIFEYT
jgi:hypothetical protein